MIHPEIIFDFAYCIRPRIILHNVAMSTFSCSFTAYVCVGLMECDLQGGFKGSKGRGEANIRQDGAVDLRHGTGMDENSQLCIQGYHPK
jgi:hypothetical protein